MHVCVLGAGIVGLATAWELRALGHEVTVIDRSAPGEGTSGGNGAQMSYSYVAPLADASIWGQLPKLMFAADSPLKLRPQWDPNQWRWGLAFLAACNTHTALGSTAHLLSLAAVSRLAFEAMYEQLGADCDFAASGKLVLYRDEAGLEAARRQCDVQQRLGGAPQRIVDAQECVALEPALAHAAGQAGNLRGAVYTPSECAVDSLKLCRALASALQARGVRLLADTPAEALDLKGGHGGRPAQRAHAVRTAAGPVEADLFVVALGSASARFGAALGCRLPVYPLKGYSITLNANDAPGAAPHMSVTDTARKTVFARIGGRLRVAGMAELVGEDLRIPPDRIATLVRSTQALFPKAALSFDELQPWAGLRPATPTGRPVVGRQPGAPVNVLFNTGHGALGLTLAFGTAREIAALVESLDGGPTSVTGTRTAA